MIEASRRGFLGGFLSSILAPGIALAMPAVIKTPGLIMPISAAPLDSSWLHPDIMGGWFQWSDVPTYLNRKQIILFDHRRMMATPRGKPMPPLIFHPEWRYREIA